MIYYSIKDMVVTYERYFYFLKKKEYSHYNIMERILFMGKDLQIRNSTVDFLVFTRDAGEDGIEVRVQDHNVWLTQKGIAQLFDVDRSVVTKH